MDYSFKTVAGLILCFSFTSVENADILVAIIVIWRHMFII
tara:strand:- start:325 stop:444 length:120 start_codon:yes stop_codon:yes gene_type:complete